MTQGISYGYSGVMYDKYNSAHLTVIIYDKKWQKQGDIFKSKIVPCSNISTLPVVLSVSCRYVPAAPDFGPQGQSDAHKGMSGVTEDYVA